VVLTDFGLATFVDDGSVTGPGMVVGSPQYVSPERARDGASTVESDLWSFGATLYAAVEGRSPFARDSAMATLMALATDEADPPVLAGPLTPVLTGLLRREPIERLTGAEVADRLHLIVAEAGLLPPAPRTSGTLFGRAVVPGPRKALDDRPEPAPAEAQAEPAAGGLGAALAAALPGMVYPPGPAAGPPEQHPSEPLTPAPPPAPEEVTPPRSRRRLLVAGAIVAVLAAGGVGTGLVLRDGRDRSQAQPGLVAATPGVTTSSGAGGSAGFSPVNCASPAPSGLPRTPVAGAGKLRRGMALYPGWSYFSDDGYNIGVPDGWSYQTIGTTICFREPGGRRILSIDPDRSPQGDPVQACRKEVTRLRAGGDLRNYTELRIDPAPGLARAADWEYTYDGRDGERMHAMTRWRAANDGKAYAIGFMTLDVDWPGNFEKWAMIQSTFFTDS
jgi:hypothetical protein